MQAIDFLDKLLRYDHQDRLTAREAMVIIKSSFFFIGRKIRAHLFTRNMVLLLF